MKLNDTAAIGKAFCLELAKAYRAGRECGELNNIPVSSYENSEVLTEMYSLGFIDGYNHYRITHFHQSGFPGLNPAKIVVEEIPTIEAKPAK